MAAAGEVAPSSRTWSDGEMIVAALSSRPIQGMRPGSEDAASFAAQHPECCRLNR